MSGRSEIAHLQLVLRANGSEREIVNLSFLIPFGQHGKLASELLEKSTDISDAIVGVVLKDENLAEKLMD